MGAGETYTNGMPYLYSAGAITGESLAFGQIYNYNSPNQNGGTAYLWSLVNDTDGPNTWMMFDAFTGNYICQIDNVPSWAQSTASGSVSAIMPIPNNEVYGADGSLTFYHLQNYGNATAPNYYLQCWNTSQAIWAGMEPFIGHEYWLWRPIIGKIYDGTRGYSINASIPAADQGSYLSGTIYAIQENKELIGGIPGKNNGTYLQPGNLWALNLTNIPEASNPSNSSYWLSQSSTNLLWNITFTPPQCAADDVQWLLDYSTFGTTLNTPGVDLVYVDPWDGVFIYANSLNISYYGYNLTTGQLLWGPTPIEAAWQFFNQNYEYRFTYIYDGMFYSCGYGGIIYAYNVTTGNLIWTYTAQQVGFESPYGNVPIDITAICNGLLYAGDGEHSPISPLWRDSYVRCINATTGQEVWKLEDYGAFFHGDHTGSRMAISDGYLIFLNSYDGQLYCVGPGPSATTVTAPDTAVPLGNQVLIRGTVTDAGPGETCLGIPAKGTPAIADADQGLWMQYLYEQQAMPTNATGVPVTLTTLDPNNNTEYIGTVTSNEQGDFAIAWKPPVPGVYQITATFAGTNSYGPSQAGTSIYVDPATSTSATSASLQVSASAGVPTSSVSTLMYIAGVAAIIIIVAIAAALLLRRRE
jgi:hypothetical protein